MRILRHYEVGVKISNPIQFFADDRNLLQQIRHNYEGRCLDGSFIVEITRIIVFSECIIVQEDLPDCGTMSVKFEAYADVYLENEIINGVTIDSTNNEIITCSGKNISVMLKMNNILKALRVGQIISVKVNRARYTIAENKVAISAVLMVPSASYYVYPVMPAVNLAILADVKERIEFELNNKTPAWATWDKILDAYKTPQKPEGKVIPIADVEKLTSGYVCRDPRIGSAPSVVVYTEPPADGELRLVPNLDAAALLLMEDYCARLRTAREMSEIYNTDKLLADHDNYLMRIFRVSKK